MERLESRLETSQNIPAKLKSLKPSQLLQFHVENQRKMKENFEKLEKGERACPHSLSNEEALCSMLEFVERNKIQEIPSCGCRKKRSYSGGQNAHLSDSWESFNRDVESSNRETESILSGDFSCPGMSSKKLSWSGPMSPSAL